jgi:hypothetical protein
MSQSPTKREAGRGLSGCLNLLIDELDLIGLLALFMLIGVGLSCWGLIVLANARASAGWTAVEGVIVSSALEHDRDAEGGDSWEPKVTYEYPAGGRQQVGVTINFGENSYDDQEEAQAILDRYPTGQAVQVYYDPDAPGRSVLEPGVSSRSYFFLATGLLFVALAVILGPVIHFFRMRK